MENGDNNTVPLLIDGKEVHTNATFNITSPATGKVNFKSSSASTKDAENAVAAVAKALPAWRDMTPSDRRDIFLRAAAIMNKRKDELVGYMEQDCGASRSWGEFNVMTARSIITDVACRISSLEGTLLTTQDPQVGCMVVNEPYGVVLAIAPWNAPYILGGRSIAFPMASGNTVVFKASESSPKSMWALCSCFEEAGLPKGVLNMIIHEPKNAAAITEQLIKHPEIKKINFTGSTAVGRIIGKLAGEQLKPVILELGGKAPAIVWEDCDLDLAADQCALGAFLNAGQICMSTERIIVHTAIREAFEKKFKASIDKIFSHDDDAPVLIHEPAAVKNRKLLRDALSKGASLLHGDVDKQESSKTRMRPIVVKGVTEEMDIYRTESFGPTVSMLEVSTEAEALRIANDTEYGLTSAIFTEDLRRGLRMAKQIEVGAVHINGMSVHDEPAMPHGGAKASGYGRFNTLSGLHEWVRTKNISYRH